MKPYAGYDDNNDPTGYIRIEAQSSQYTAPKAELLAILKPWLAEHDREVAVRVLRDLSDSFMMAANAGVEPELNAAAAKLIRNRANLFEGQGLT